MTMPIGLSQGCGFQYPVPPSAATMAIGGNRRPLIRSAGACGRVIPDSASV